MFPTSSSATAIYLYGFTESLPHVPMLNGIDDIHAVSQHRYAGLTAVISTVALADFTGQTGEAHLQDVAWLTPRACRHALVIDQCRLYTAVYPVAFGTLFSTLAALEQEMQQRTTDVLAVLHHISGCEEWAVEASLERNQTIDALFAENLQSGRFRLPDSAGRRHLEEQKLRRQLNHELNDWLNCCLTQWQQELNGLTRDFRPRRLTDNKILHWAYLLPATDVVAFQAYLAALIQRYSDYGFHFRVTGPWAAYSFCQHPSS